MSQANVGELVTDPARIAALDKIFGVTSRDQTGKAQPPARPMTTPAGSPDGELLISAAGQNFTGWTSVRVTAGVMRTPRDFEVQATVKLPGEVRDIIQPNTAVTLSIGGHVVLTGYVERVQRRVAAGSHTVSFGGRGRCCDLVDGAALAPNLAVMDANLIGLAKTLVLPFSAGAIQIITPDGPGSGRAFNYQINLGETVYEILDKFSRYEGLLPYEDANGNLVFARVGQVAHASGFSESQNVQEIEVSANFDERFSVYIPLIMSSSSFNANALGINSAGSPVTDPGVNRYRPRMIISEQLTQDGSLASIRALWESTRRAGQATRITVTADSWLDSAGTPWTPNQTASIALPSIAINQAGWVITEVQFARDMQSGTTARVTLMPPEALSIEPQALSNLGNRFAPTPAAAASPLGNATAPSPSPSAPNAAPSGSANPTGQGL